MTQSIQISASIENPVEKRKREFYQETPARQTARHTLTGPRALFFAGGDQAIEPKGIVQSPLGRFSFGFGCEGTTEYPG